MKTKAHRKEALRSSDLDSLIFQANALADDYAKSVATRYSNFSPSITSFEAAKKQHSQLCSGLSLLLLAWPKVDLSRLKKGPLRTQPELGRYPHLRSGDLRLMADDVPLPLSSRRMHWGGGRLLPQHVLQQGHSPT